MNMPLFEGIEPLRAMCRHCGGQGKLVRFKKPPSVVTYGHEIFVRVECSGCTFVTRSKIDSNWSIEDQWDCFRRGVPIKIVYDRWEHKGNKIITMEDYYKSNKEERPVSKS